LARGLTIPRGKIEKGVAGALIPEVLRVPQRIVTSVCATGCCSHRLVVYVERLYGYTPARK
jgi:hypothetical protein